ncbi:MAG: response regulator, partial [Anaerolineaceae bacterium]
MTDKQPNHWHILYIEDDQDDFLILKSMLAGIEEKSIQIDWAQTIQAGQEKIRSRLYDAVLVDYDLGAETGIEIIRDFHAAYPVPFILFTAHDSPEFDQQAQQA